MKFLDIKKDVTGITTLQHTAGTPSTNRHFVSNLMDLAKWNYCLDYIKEHHFDIKDIFSMSNKMLRKSSNTPLPDHEDLTDLANGFNNFFVDKIKNIMRNLVSMESNTSDPIYI